MDYVRDLMTKDPAVCTPETPLPTVARLMCEHSCGEIPVVDSKQSMKPVGVITDRDITCRTVGFGKNPLELRAADAMTKSVVTAKIGDSIDSCIELLERHQIRRLPIVDDGGRIVGILAQADIARKEPAEKTAEVVREVSQVH